MPAMTTPNLDHIIEPLRPFAVPVDSVANDPANPRSHNDRNLQAIKSSLVRFGQRFPILVNKRTNTVIAGNGRLEAARLLGWSHVAVMFTDDDNVTATAFAIADNRSAELAEWDFQTLSSLMKSIQPNIDLKLLGWEEHETEPLLSADWTPPPLEPLDSHQHADTDDDPNELKLTPEQRLKLDDAIDVVRLKHGEQLTDGDALMIICQDFIDANDEKPSPTPTTAATT
jgi:hypothetical protein